MWWQGVNPVRLLVKRPVPVMFNVVSLLVVGPVFVAQQTPLAVTDAPPSDEIFPPDEAVVSRLI